MKIPFFLFIAFRFFIRSNINNNRNINSINSLVAIISILIGVSILIIGSSAMNGFERELKDRFLNIIPHGEIELIDSKNINWKKEMKKIQYFSDITSVSPYLSFSALIKNENKFKIIQIRGTDFSVEEKKWISRYIQKFSSWENLFCSGNKILIGNGIAKNINVKYGEWITLIVPNQSKNLIQSKYINMKVSGIFTSNSQVDHNLAIISLNDAQKYTNKKNKISGFTIRVNRIFNIDDIIMKIKRKINIPVKIYSWITKYEYMYKDIQKIRIIIYFSCILIIFISCISIASAISIVLQDKQVSIIVFSILGVNHNLIRYIFVIYGLLSGCIGIFLGIIFGSTIAINLSFLFKKLENVLGKCLLSDNIYFINFFPSEIHIKDILWITCISILLILVSSWCTTLRIKKLNMISYIKQKIKN